MDDSRVRRDGQVLPIGFIGLGAMGEPMALNLARSGTPLLVWNRSAAKSRILVSAGAQVADGPAQVFERCRVVILMLYDASVTDAVLGRRADGFQVEIADRTVVNMATVAPRYSQELKADIVARGGRYVEAPVSGSRTPAEQGRLVTMMAGEASDVEAVRPLVLPMSKNVVTCGPVPNALSMKLAVNLFLITMVTGLVEAFHFGDRLGLDVAQLAAVLDMGPMASDVSRSKVKKLVEDDLTMQAGIANVLENNRLIAEAARDANIASPLLDVCHELFGEADAMGLGRDDMIAVIRAIERRTVALA